jgi:RNA polymerase sigma factor (sigma-70 family)
LYRVAVNTCYMALRRQRTARRFLSWLGLGPNDTAPSVEQKVRAKKALSALEAAIGDMPAKERAIMVMLYVEGKSQTEAASFLGLSKGQVSKLHSRALGILHAQDWEVETNPGVMHRSSDQPSN